MPTRDALTIRSSKGSALSFNEMDDNFVTLADTIDLLTSYDIGITTTTLGTTDKTIIATYTASSFRSTKLVIQIRDTITGEVQISEMLLVHNGSVASSTEYGVVYTGSVSLVTLDVDLVSGNVRLLAQRTTANSTQYKISRTIVLT